MNFKCTLLVSSQEAIAVPLSAVIVKGGVLINFNQTLFFPVPQNQLCAGSLLGSNMKQKCLAFNFH